MSDKTLGAGTAGRNQKRVRIWLLVASKTERRNDAYLGRSERRNRSKNFLGVVARRLRPEKRLHRKTGPASQKDRREDLMASGPAFDSQGGRASPPRLVKKIGHFSRLVATQDTIVQVVALDPKRRVFTYSLVQTRKANHGSGHSPDYTTADFGGFSAMRFPRFCVLS